jgi:hypothetical protein
MYDAGETARGLKHLVLLKKPDAFELGASDPNDPKVNKTLSTVLGVADPSQMPSSMKLVLAGLGFANSDIAFQGNRLFLGNFYGVNIYDISNPAQTKLLTSMICPRRPRGIVGLQESYVYVGGDDERSRRLRHAGFSADPTAGCGTRE